MIPGSSVVVGMGDRCFEVTETSSGGIVVKQQIPAVMVDWYNYETKAYEKYERLGHWRVMRPGPMREAVILAAFGQRSTGI